jgi:hypothetical protein
MVGGYVPAQNPHHGERGPLGRPTVASEACYSATRLGHSGCGRCSGFELSPSCRLPLIIRQSLTSGCRRSLLRPKKLRRVQLRRDRNVPPPLNLSVAFVALGPIERSAPNLSRGICGGSPTLGGYHFPSDSNGSARHHHTMSPRYRSC